MGILNRLFGATSEPEPRRSPVVEALEDRRLMAADVILGAVYFEEATGDDSQPDIIQVSFEGGAAGTTLDRIVISGDKEGDGELSRGDVFFDTAPGGRGDFDSVPLSIVDSDGFEVTGVSVVDGGTSIVFNLSGFEAGELLVFSVDVDEFQAVNPITGEPRDNALVEGSEFEFSSLVGEFSAPGFVDLNLSGLFFDFFDDNRSVTETDAEAELTRLTDDADNPNDPTAPGDFIDRTAGAVAHAPQVELATLSGFVYHDASDDGIFDPDENPIAGVTVELLNDVGEVIATTQTGDDGAYEFIDLVAGTYSVRETQPNDFFDGRDTAGTIDGATVGTATNDLISGVTLDFGDDSINNNFGELLGGSIAGLVHASEDGDCDFDDPGVLLSGVTIELLDPSGRVIRTTTTGDDGRYRFDNLAPGEYAVRQVQPTDLNGRPLFDGAERAGTADGAVSDDLITEIRIGNEEDAVNYDFCEHFGATLSGFVYHDESNDGAFDASEDPIPGTTVTLFRNAGDQLVPTGRSSVTDGTGFYEFTDLEPGEYTVVETQPDGFLDGIDTAGTLSGDVSTNDVIASIMLAFGDNSRNNNFGELLPGSIAGRVHASTDGDCDFDDPDILLEEVTIQLLDENGDVIRETLTDANGEYRFDNLAPGVYAVREVQPNEVNGLTLFDGEERAGSADGMVSNDTVTGIVLGSGEDAVDYDFCEHVGASLSGFVYHDESDDGVFDANEDPIAGVLVDLVDTATGQVVASTTTNTDGFYQFTNLNAGTYGVRETQPTAFFDGQDTLGTIGGASVGVGSNDRLTEITLDFGDEGINYNFGELLGASIAGRVHAQNGPDCDFDNPDVLLEGVTIQLLDANGDLVSETQTDANGQYRFEGLRPGEYQVRQLQPASFQGRALFDGSENVGDADGISSDDLISGVVLGSGQDAVDYNFCEHFGASISGFVYHDQDDDGVFDIGEDPIPGTTLKLFREEAGQMIDTGRTVVTDSRGFYEFTDLAPGKYTVMENQPEGFFDGRDTPGSLGGDASQNDMIAMIMLDFGDESTDNNFGELLPGSIAGRVHASMDGDCDFDDPDILLEGVTLQLLNESGDVIRETQTNTDGEYRFDDLPPGVYSVRELQPADYFNGEQRVGTGRGSNFGVDTIGDIVLGSDQDFVNYDFCEIPPAQLSGFVFVDGGPIVRFVDEPITPQEVAQMRDGARTPDDQPIEGVLIQLRNGRTGQVINGQDLLPGVYPDGPVATLTDASGFYEFTGLPAGVYSVVEVQPLQLVDGIDTVGSLGGAAINPTADGLPQPFPQSVAPIANDFANTFGSDVILLIDLGIGQSSVENNFSEVATSTVIIPPEPPEPPTPEPPPVTPLAAAAPPVLLTPFTPPPRITYPVYGGSHTSLGWTWHLSIVNGGDPRTAEINATETEVANAKLNQEAWADARMERAEWELAEWRTVGDEEDPIDGESDVVRRLIFGNENAIAVAGDWDGDGTTNLGVFADGYWYLDLNGNGQWDAGDLFAKLGSGSDLPVVGDWDADGKDDIGIFGPAWSRDPHAIAHEPGLPDAENRPTRLVDDAGRLLAKNMPPTAEDATSGARLLRRTAELDGRADRIDHVFHYGTPGDAPLAGDWNGDGVRTIGVFRDGVWTLDTDGDGRLTDRDESFATVSGDPVVGDWDGDGIDDIGVFRGGKWLVDITGDRQLDARDTAFELGGPEDSPVVGDWDGDGVDDPGAYGPDEGQIRLSRKAG